MKSSSPTWKMETVLYFLLLTLVWRWRALDSSIRFPRQVPLGYHQRPDSSWQLPPHLSAVKKLPISPAPEQDSMCEMEAVIKIFHSRGFLPKKSFVIVAIHLWSVLVETKTEIPLLPPASGCYHDFPRIRIRDGSWIKEKVYKVHLLKKKRITTMDFQKQQVLGFLSTMAFILDCKTWIIYLYSFSLFLPFPSLKSYSYILSPRPS